MLCYMVLQQLIFFGKFICRELFTGDTCVVNLVKVLAPCHFLFDGVCSSHFHCMAVPGVSWNQDGRAGPTIKFCFVRTN